RHRRRSHPREHSRQLSGPTHAKTHTRNSGHAAVGSCGVPDATGTTGSISQEIRTRRFRDAQFLPIAPGSKSALSGTRRASGRLPADLSAVARSAEVEARRAKAEPASPKRRVKAGREGGSYRMAEE